MSTQQQEAPEVPCGGRAWAEAMSLAPLPPNDGPFLDIASAQADFLARLRCARRPEGWLFERRQCPTSAERVPVDPLARRSPAGEWLPWLRGLGSALRCVRVAPQLDLGEIRAEVQELSAAGVSVRVVSEEPAARAVVPEVLVLGRSRAYALVYDREVVIGATVVDDLRLVGRWRAAIARLHDTGIRPAAGRDAA